MRIGVDLDETKINTVEGLLKFNNYIIGGVPLVKEQITNYDMAEISEMKAGGVTREQLIKIFNTFHLEGPINLITPIDGCREVLQKLKDEGAEIVTLTARETAVKNRTIDIIDTLFPGLIHDIIFANHYTDKAKGKGILCRENNLDMMIEDNISYAEDVVSKGVPVHLIEQPRNRIYDKSYKVYGIHHHKNRDGIGRAIMSK